MRRIKSDKLEPWQLFDLIAGTSTGGLIALMLDRFHKSVDECISAYMDCSKAMHEPKRAKYNAFMTPPFRSTPAEQIMQEIIRKRRFSYPTSDDSMRNPDSPCKVFVLSSQASTGTPFPLRSYDNPQSPCPTIDCKVWEAARATTATSPFFRQFGIEASGSIEFGASEFYNPIDNVWNEARILWPGRKIISVSIGAGAAPRNKFSGELGASIEVVARASAHAEGITHTFELQQTGTSMESSLYRFSAPTLANIGLEEHDAVADVEAATQSYLRSMEMQDPLRRCVDDLFEINSEEKSNAVKQFEAQRAYELKPREFLVAKLLVESLIGKVTIREIKSALSSLPPDLHATYEAMFERVEEQNHSSRDLAFRALPWAYYAERPLTAVELQHALAVETGKGSLDVENLVDIEELISVCGGFLAVTAESKLITLIHTTAEEYFGRHWNPQMATGEVAIASTCLTYLCFDCFANGRCDDDEALQRRLTKHPFLDYASRFWGNIAREVPEGEVDGELTDLALKLLTHDGRVSTCTQIMLLPDGHTPHSSETTPEVISGLHLAAHVNIERLAHRLLKRGSDICVRDSWGRDPLAWAVVYNIPRMARFLLDSKADIELKDNQGRTHLAPAATCGFINMANELLRRGADLSARDSTGQNALSLAASHGRLSLVQDFLGEPDIEVDSRDDLGRTPLLCAADQGHEDVVACLAAQASVDINTQNNMGETPLIASARRGWTGVVQILLEQNSILPNLKDRSGRTAVMWAVIEGQLEVLQLLLSREDAIEALKSADLSGKFPFDWAINGNNLPIQELISSRLKGGDSSSG
ncbi:hypothetical protein JMJ35_003039 [Cladonia borealis]|uniref:phospholipase A2 n=1 Tax=Cladonia borealis TaxID=184061 RepID=A0AA39V3G2_9LECA|nr:hypothetical protein JMJ35_003039 [Cladonia borealis]